MRTVHKYMLSLRDAASWRVQLPAAAKVVHVGQQANDEVCVWLELDTSHPLAKEPRHFHVVGTGHPVPEGFHHVGAVVGDLYVWHVYEEGRP